MLLRYAFAALFRVFCPLYRRVLDVTLPVVIDLECHELISIPRGITDHLNRLPLFTLKRSVSMSKIVKTDTLV